MNQPEGPRSGHPAPAGAQNVRGNDAPKRCWGARCVHTNPHRHSRCHRRRRQQTWGDHVSPFPRTQLEVLGDSSCLTGVKDFNPQKSDMRRKWGFVWGARRFPVSWGHGRHGCTGLTGAPCWLPAGLCCEDLPSQAGTPHRPSRAPPAGPRESRASRAASPHPQSKEGARGVQGSSASPKQVQAHSPVLEPPPRCRQGGGGARLRAHLPGPLSRPRPHPGPDPASWGARAGDPPG